MELIAEHDRRVSVEELDTARLLSHARKQAVERQLDESGLAWIPFLMQRLDHEYMMRPYENRSDVVRGFSASVPNTSPGLVRIL
jgi:hypothetical protein